MVWPLKKITLVFFTDSLREAAKKSFFFKYKKKFEEGGVGGSVSAVNLLEQGRI